MSREYRIMFLSEKSGRSYTVKMRLLPMLMALIGMCCFFAATVFVFQRWWELYMTNRTLATRVDALQADLAKIKDENTEAVLYKQWADRIIFRRLNYEDMTGRDIEAQHPEPRSGEVDAANDSAKQTVDVDEFDVRRINLDLDFEVSFKLINRARNHRKVSGYVYIIAGNNDVKPEIYTSWPRGELVSGMPTDYKKGIGFSIRYLKFIKGRIEQPDIGPKYNRVDLIAYSEDGNIIMKKGFYVERFLQQSPYE